MCLSFNQILGLAQKRKLFHQYLSFEEKNNTLDFSEIRALSIDWGIPLRKSKNDEKEIQTDFASFYSLMLSSICSKEEISEFAESEKRLFYYRLKISKASPLSICDYFWPNENIHKLIINQVNDNGIYYLKFQDCINFFDTSTLEIRKGIVIINHEHIYQMITENFKNKIIKNINKYITSSENINLSLCLNKEILRLEKENNFLTLENLDVYAEQHFPACMYRIYSNLKKHHSASFNGRFEFSLFLKSIGINYFEQFDLWKKFLFKDGEEWHFESQINLFLKQLYGLTEAENTFYFPHKCITMINHDNPSSMKLIQGCPFKSMSKADLKILLKKMRRGIKHANIDKLTTNADKNPEDACLQFFNEKFQNDIRNKKFERPKDFFFESIEKSKKNQ